MSDFVSYDTSTYNKVANYSSSKIGAQLKTPVGNTFAQYESNAPIGPGSEYESNNSPFKKNGEAPFEWSSGPMSTNTAQLITGSAYAEKEIEVIVEQSFNYKRKIAEGKYDVMEGNWDVTETALVVKAGETKHFSVNVLAPYARIKIINKATEENKEVRVFARSQVQGR